MNPSQFTVLDIIKLISNSHWDMDYFLPNQNEVTDRINKRLGGETIPFENQNEEYIFRRCEDKVAGDALEADNIVKYSGIDPHPAQQIEIGAILVSSWGYDQTNVDFYVVVEMTAKTVKLLPMVKYSCRNQKEGFSTMAGETRATKTIKFRDEVIKRKAGAWIKIDSCSSARLWDGKKEYESWYH